MAIQIPYGERGGIADPGVPATTTPPRKLAAGTVSGHEIRLWNRAPAVGALAPVGGIPYRLPDGSLGGVPGKKLYAWEGLLSGRSIPRNTPPEQMRIARERVKRANQAAITAGYGARAFIPPGPAPLAYAEALRIKPTRPNLYAGVLRDLAPRTVVRDTTLGRDTTPYSVTRDIIRQAATNVAQPAPTPAPTGSAPGRAAITASMAQSIQAGVSAPSAEVKPPAPSAGTKVLYLIAAAGALFLVVRGHA